MQHETHNWNTFDKCEKLPFKMSFKVKVLQEMDSRTEY